MNVGRANVPDGRTPNTRSKKKAVLEEVALENKRRWEERSNFRFSDKANSR